MKEKWLFNQLSQFKHLNLIFNSKTGALNVQVATGKIFNLFVHMSQLYFL